MNWPFVLDEHADEDVRAEAAMWAPYVRAVRELIDVSVRTAVDEGEIRAATTEVEAIVARLRTRQLDTTLGTTNAPSGIRRPWGNPVIGVRNPMTPSMVTRSDSSGRVFGEFHCGAAYEGPPGLVHGGFVSMVLDQILGQAVGTGGRPGMTGTLTVVYRQGTPLGDLRTEAWIERTEGIKTWAKGHITGPEGITAEAEGVFIVPRWAR